MSALLAKMEQLAPLIGNSPLVKLEPEDVDLYVKLEYTNLTGSVKDRAAYNIICQALKKGLINDNTTIIESSSGNFAVALATVCRHLGLKFICVIDPNINAMNEQKLHTLASKVVKVSERDETGGFLLTRIRYIQEYVKTHEHIFWTNQYENPDNYMGYYHTLGVEIEHAFPRLDYVFTAVSSGGTITGLSIKLKEVYKHVKIIAVDVEGSVIFGSPPRKRTLSGMGSSKVPPILANAKIDDVIILSEDNIKQGARDLYYRHNIYGGASCGACYYAIDQYFQTHSFSDKPAVLFLCPDYGESYAQAIYEPAESIPAGHS